MQKKYQCCFCGECIESNNTDVTALIVVSNWEKKVDHQQEQQLFCHMKCLKKKINPNTSLYIADLID